MSTSKRCPVRVKSAMGSPWELLLARFIGTIWREIVQVKVAISTNGSLRQSMRQLSVGPPKGPLLNSVMSPLGSNFTFAASVGVMPSGRPARAIVSLLRRLKLAPSTGWSGFAEEMLPMVSRSWCAMLVRSQWVS